MGGIFRYQRPRLALCVVIAMGLCIATLLAPMDFVQKFAWLISSGFALGLLTAGARLMAQPGNDNLAVLMFFASAVLLVFGIAATPGAIFAASALEDFAAPFVGAALGYFVSDD